LAALLAELTEFRSAQEIHELLQQRRETVGLSTVSRNLQAMAEAGRLDVLHLGSGEAMFRQCSTRRHHHLVCRVCDLTEEIAEPSVEAWEASTSPRSTATSRPPTTSRSSGCAPTVPPRPPTEPLTSPAAGGA
jgi:Fur family ferric uptake transcriptional regulator